MTEEKETNVDADQSDKKETVKEVTFNYKGKEVTLPYEKVINYANMGFDYSNKMSELKKKEHALAEEETAVALGKDLLRLKQEDPEKARRIIAIANGQDVSSMVSRNGGNDRSEIDESAMTETEAALYRQNQILAAQIEKLSTTVQGLGGMFHEDRQESIRSKVEREIDSACKEIPDWTAEHIEFFKPQIAEVMKQGIGATEAALIIASGHRKLKDAEARAAEARKTANMRYRTEPPWAGTPNLAPKRKYTAKNLKDGSIVQDAMETARKFFPNW